VKFDRQGLVKLAPYGPLVAVGVEFFWLFVLFLIEWGIEGDASPENKALERAIILLGVIPAALGLFLGVWCIRKRWVHRAPEWICLTLGSLICVAFVGSLVWGAI
jgi:hypothetical protein